jgi:hypothetical protein
MINAVIDTSTHVIAQPIPTASFPGSGLNSAADIPVSGVAALQPGHWPDL